MAIREMRKVIKLGSWQVSIALAISRQPQLDPRLQLPTEGELQAMAKDVYQKFYKAKGDGRG